MLSSLSEICDRIRAHFAGQDRAREEAYNLSRQVIRLAASCIRSVHRKQNQEALSLLEQTGAATNQMIEAVSDQPSLRYGGFIADAEKEYAEAAITYAVIGGSALPSPEELQITYAPWLNGLAEAGGEFRRHCLDLIREDRIEEAEKYLDIMDEIYHAIMGFDYPNAISYGLRGRSDALRGMIERTRGDMTNALRQARLEQRLAELEQMLSE